MMFSSVLKSHGRLGAIGVKYCLRRLISTKTSTIKHVRGCRSFATDTNVPTIGEIIKEWSKRFEEEGVSEPVESIEHILAHILGTTKVTDVLNARDKRLSNDQIAKLETLCTCRLARMPVQYIIGEWDFRDITLNLVPPVFIPRPETEILVDYVIKRMQMEKRMYEVLEIGCGSGAISLALAHSCNMVKCTALDASLHACKLSNENRERLGLSDRVTIAQGTLKEDGTIDIPDDLKSVVNLDSQNFDFIVSNPPYVPTKMIQKLAPEIKLYEDLRALDGGEDGLKIIKPLLKYGSRALKPGGRVLLEVDSSHPEYIKYFTEKYPDLKLHYEHTYKDFCNNDRFVEVLKIS